mmetsp:Transcript_27744/g.58303  ORF Transcript_27744/g.58303 Transcript_27744/m.58303 type:complete len:529 (-) Transcript_27744:63-1649(-)
MISASTHQMLLRRKLSAHVLGGFGSRCHHYLCGKLPIQMDASCTIGITIIQKASVRKAFNFAERSSARISSYAKFEFSKYRSPLNKSSQIFQPIPPRNVDIAVVSFSSARENATTQVADAASTTSATDAATNVDSNLKIPSLSAQCVKPRATFPWRHSPHPLPRLVVPRISDTSGLEGDENDDSEDSAKNDGDKNNLKEEILESDYFKKGGPLGPGWPSPMDPWFRASTFASSMHVYGLPWYAIVLPWMRNEWIDEMEWSFCEAFSMGVRGMIEDTYCLDNGKNKKYGDDDESENFDVDFDTTIDATPLSEEKDETKTEKQVECDDSKTDDMLDHDAEQLYMLQRDLRQLYKSARKHSLSTKNNVLLRMQPQFARIESMFPVFGLNRQLVQDHPALRHSYRNLVRNLQRKHKEAQLAGRKRLNPIEVISHINGDLNELIDSTAKLTNDGKAVTTIIAQVSIQCREVFCVRDLESGEIVQGDTDGQPRDVTHLVRFEICIKDSHEGDFEIGRWQITDWDDLLDGNVWFT